MHAKNLRFTVIVLSRQPQGYITTKYLFS